MSESADVSRPEEIFIDVFGEDVFGRARFFLFRSIPVRKIDKLLVFNEAF